MATEIPMTSPVVASAPAQPSNWPAVTGALSNWGHRDERAIVKPIARAARAGSTTARMPGSGTNTSAELTRASTSRKPYNVPAESVRLAGIATQVSQEHGGVRHDLLQH